MNLEPIMGKPLWGHQKNAYEDIVEAVLEGHKRILVTCPTGGGKTALGAVLIRDEFPKSVWYTHRKILCNQTARVFKQCGLDPGIRASGTDPALLRELQVAMIQTESSRCFPKENKDGVIVKKPQYPLAKSNTGWIDEAHNNSKGQMQRILEEHRKQNPDFVTIGLTATPLGLGHFYDHLIVAGTNKQLREAGSHVICYQYSPDEPSSDLVGKVKIGEGECGIEEKYRGRYVQQIFGSVIKHYNELNPEHKPTIMFAPGVKESIWFARELTKAGIRTAHIDGNNAWLDGEEITKDQDVVDDILAQSKSGDIKIITNRFVLREGIDAPWIQYGILATIFGSLTSYLQAGGRIIRADPEGDFDHVTVIDHGGNYWRHGSLNSTRHWKLEYTDKMVSDLRLQRIREEDEAPKPITCPKCLVNRAGGDTCFKCGFKYEKTDRMVMQTNGKLTLMSNKTFQKRRYLTPTQKLQDKWTQRVRAIRKSKKSHVQRMTWKQLETSVMRDDDSHGKWPPRTLKDQPIEPIDWYLKIRDTPADRLRT